MEVIGFFRLREESVVQIKSEVLANVGNWEAVAMKAGLGRTQRQAMASAFNVLRMV